MLITRKNPVAGRKLGVHSFPVCVDSETGIMGKKVGYCTKCGEELIIATPEMRLIAHEFAYDLSRYEKLLKGLVEVQKIPMVVRIANKLLSWENKRKQKLKPEYQYFGLDEKGDN